MQNKRQRLRDKFHKLFADEAAKRGERPDLTWVEAEAAAMCIAVNRDRASLGKSPLDRARYVRMEMGCAGHSDYHSKLALGCMELVLDEG